MVWKQRPSPLHYDNSTAVGMTNCTLISRKSKYWYLRLSWVRCREAQNQFRIYWYKSPNNNSDYSTKHHPIIYHEYKRAFLAVCFILTFALNVETLCLEKIEFQQGCVDDLLSIYTYDLLYICPTFGP